MKILLFGKNGQVGWELNRSLLPVGEVISLGREDADFSDPEGLRVIVQSIQPDFIVNAVAFTAVDKAEEEEALAVTINSEAPKVLAEEAASLGAVLVHYSTDYVFDGEKHGIYTEEDDPNPINAYGRSKLAGELAVQSSGCSYMILRTSWVYASRGKNFLLTILKLAKERDSLSIVSDQTGAPTSARLIADVTSHCIQRLAHLGAQDGFKSDIYHLNSAGSATWYEFAKAIVGAIEDNGGLKLPLAEITAINASEFKTLAKRPMNSRLASGKLEKAFSLAMPGWEQGLELCLKELRRAPDLK